MDTIAGLIPLALIGYVVWALLGKRKKAMAARASAASLAAAAGGSAGARADVGGINLHLHFGTNVTGRGADDDDRTGDNNNVRHFAIPVDLRPGLTSGDDEAAMRAIGDNAVGTRGGAHVLRRGRTGARVDDGDYGVTEW